jgi:ATP-binding cassette subfamily B protein RaxB
MVDDAPLGPATNAAWRGRIGAVLQDDHLLTGTLADNIAFFDQKLDQERIEASARAARIHDDIAKMPMAYQSLIGDMGAALFSRPAPADHARPRPLSGSRRLVPRRGHRNLDDENEAAIADLIARLPITRSWLPTARR